MLAEKTTKLYGIFKTAAPSTRRRLEQTTLTSLDEVELLKETLATRKDHATVLRTTLNLLGMASATKAKPEEVRSWAARAVKAAETYGPRWHRDVVLLVVEILSEQKGYEPIALTYRGRPSACSTTRTGPASARKCSSLASASDQGGQDRRGQGGGGAHQED